MLSIAFYTLSAVAFLIWCPNAIAMWNGFKKLPMLECFDALSDADCPSLSIIVPACNEAHTVEPAMRTLLQIDYPNLQIVAINDRSTDDTGKILDALAKQDARLSVLHIASLPPGWLGKNHALQRGADQASGHWLLFTDADIHFAPDALRRALALARSSDCDHLVALPHMILEGFWEKILVSFFGVMFCFRFRPWLALQRGSKWHMGVGAFNLIKATAYRAIGRHENLRMDVLDDVKLGKLVKENGLSQNVTQSGPLISVRWLTGLGGIVNGLEKNAFAGNSYSWFMTLSGCALIVLTVCWPFAGIFFAPLIAKLFCAAAILGMLLAAKTLARMSPAFSFYALMWPLSALVFAYIMLRSAWIATLQGGIRWRGTQYDLNELKKRQA